MRSPPIRVWSSLGSEAHVRVDLVVRGQIGAGLRVRRGRVVTRIEDRVARVVRARVGGRVIGRVSRCLSCRHVGRRVDRCMLVDRGRRVAGSQRACTTGIGIAMRAGDYRPAVRAGGHLSTSRS